MYTKLDLDKMNGKKVIIVLKRDNVPMCGIFCKGAVPKMFGRQHEDTYEKGYHFLKDGKEKLYYSWIAPKEIKSIKVVEL